MSNSTRLWKLLKTAEFRTPTPQDVRKKGSKILKLPAVRNCFTLAMTNKLVVIINSLKVPKVKKILLYEMKFLVANYSCLQNPWLGGHRPQIPVLTVVCPQLNLLNPPKQNSWVRLCLKVSPVCDSPNTVYICLAVLLWHSSILFGWSLNFSHHSSWSPAHYCWSPTSSYQMQDHLFSPDQPIPVCLRIIWR